MDRGDNYHVELRVGCNFVFELLRGEREMSTEGHSKRNLVTRVMHYYFGISAYFPIICRSSL